MKWGVGRQGADMFFENPNQCLSVVIVGTSTKDFPIFWIEKRQKIYGTIAFV